MFNYKKIILATFCLMMPAVALSTEYNDDFFKYEPSLSLKFGGWSKHVVKNNDNYNYNENHKGIGFDFNFIQTQDDHHSISFEYFKMKDSFSVDASHVGFTYKYSPVFNNAFLDAIDYKLSIMYMDRGNRVINSYSGVPNYDEYRITRKTAIKLLPYISITPYDYLGIDLMYIPSLTMTDPKHTFFIRANVNLSKLVSLMK